MRLERQKKRAAASAMAQSGASAGN